MLGKKVAIDLGTATVRVAVKSEPGVVVEPAYVAVDERGGIETVGAGSWSATPGRTLVRPMVDGVIADPPALEHLLHQVINRVTGRQRIFKPDLMIAVPSGLPGDHRRLLLEACMRAGARTTFLLDSILAAAIGTGLPIDGPRGRLVIDAGAGRVELCIIAMEGCVVRALGPGTEQLGGAIAAAVAQRCAITLEAAALEDVQRELAGATLAPEERTMRVEGRSSRDRALQQCTVSDRDIDDAVRSWVQRIDGALLELLASTPPALRAGLAGGRLTGGGARLRGLDRHLSQLSGLEVEVAAEPEQCTLRGCLAALDNLDLLKRNLLYIR